MGRLTMLAPRVPASAPAQRAAGSWGTSTASAHDRGYGWAWKKQRAVVLNRDQGLCRTCRASGRVTAATEVDHIVPKSSGGSDDESNLQAICADCHKAKTAREAQGARS